MLHCFLGTTSYWFETVAFANVKSQAAITVKIARNRNKKGQILKSNFKWDLRTLDLSGGLQPMLLTNATVPVTE